MTTLDERAEGKRQTVINMFAPSDFAGSVQTRWVFDQPCQKVLVIKGVKFLRVWIIPVSLTLSDG
jgi:hypothetical protein